MFSHLVGLFSLVVTLLTGAGVGGWAYPDTPLLGRIARAFVPDSQWLARAQNPSAGAGLPTGNLPLANPHESSLRDRLSQAVGQAATQAVQQATSPYRQPATSPAGAARSAPGSPGANGYPVSPARWQTSNNANGRREHLTIASYNIQVFGASKLNDQQVMAYLADIVRRFDLVAIQEIRTQDDQHMPQFLRMINATGRRYHYVVGPRLGRTSSKEQYAYIYDTEVLEHHPSSALTVSDPQDQLHRPPLLSLFRTRTPNPADGFSFWLINTHTDPDEVPTEVDALALAFQSVQQQGWGEDDVILLGDLNASPSQLGKLGTLPGIAYAIPGTPTNTRKTKSYDNVLFDRRATREFLGQASVLDVMHEYGLTQEQALKLSDHLPVWAVFSMYEATATPNVATR
jgi:endonuclease/exonuclease/phosphatase family metal-dependent hydrolase